ncbi:MAG: FkbM family methyltransferase [Gammaproteobacteria bacterium]
MTMEALRRWVRARLGYDSLVYRTAARLVNASALLVRAGPRTTWAVWRLRRAPPNTEASLHFPGILHPFVVRAGTRDIGTVINNFVRREYGQLPDDFVPATIIDAGAYVGDTSAYFLSRYPAARVIALEPAGDSHRQATRNLAPYGARVDLRKAALGGTRGTVRIAGRETGAGIAADGEAVLMMTVPDLIGELPDERVDLLKLDIEGAETGVLDESAASWLALVRCIVLETHGPAAEQIALGTLRRAGWSVRRFRNLWYCFPATS